MRKLYKLAFCAIATATIFGAIVSDASAQCWGLRGWFGWRRAACSSGYCVSGGCANGYCASRSCSSGYCASGGCANGYCASRSCSSGYCASGGCANGYCASGGCANGYCASGGCANGVCADKSCDLRIYDAETGEELKSELTSKSATCGAANCDCSPCDKNACALNGCVADELRMTEEERAIFSAINVARARYHLRPLSFDSRETVNVRNNSEYCRRWGLGHWLPATAPEIAAQSWSPESACQQWINSNAGHREILLGAYYSHVSVGVARRGSSFFYTARIW